MVRLLKSLLWSMSSMWGLFGWGFVYRPAVRLERVRVLVPGLPEHLEGFTIGLLTDLHLGPLVSAAFVRRAAEQLAALKPDLVVVAGDLCSTRKAAPLLEEALAPVGRPFAVLGNWDVIRDPVRSTPTVRFLINQGLEAAPGLWLAGVDDVKFGQPDLDAALSGAPPEAVRILLAHEPDFADRVEARHQIALQLSGHSHGGQIRLPFLPPALLPVLGRKYVAGLYQAPHCQVYTSRGLGVVHLPVRFNCPPEISLIELRGQEKRWGHGVVADRVAEAT